MMQVICIPGGPAVPKGGLSGCEGGASLTDVLCSLPLLSSAHQVYGPYPLAAPGCTLIHADLVGFMAQEVTSLMKTAAPQYP